MACQIQCICKQSINFYRFDIRKIMKSNIASNPTKIELRSKIKKALKLMSSNDRINQSKLITRKILSMPAFQESKRISIYLSLDSEVNTNDILKEMFKLDKQVFVPSYSGSQMVMLKLKNLQDYDNLPLTKWNIKQPNVADGRENANETGGLDLILMPGVAFTRSGGRCGHGMGYYDKYITKLFTDVSEKSHQHIHLRGKIDEKLKEQQTILLGLAFNQQIINDIDMPIDPNDVLLDAVITSE